MRKSDQEENHDSTDHIHQHENTTIASKHKPKTRLRAITCYIMADTILWSRDMDQLRNLCCKDLVPLRCGYIEEY